MKKCDVILVEAGGNVGYQVLRSLVRRGLSVAVCDTRADGVAFHSRFTRGKRFLIAPPVKHEGEYIARLHSLVTQTGASVVIPIFHPEVLGRHKDEFPGVTIPVAASGLLELLDDKKMACSLAASLGVPQPKMYSSPSDVQSYPVVFKRVKGQGGDSVYFPANEKALLNLVSKSKQGSYLIMDYIEGYDVCVDAIRIGNTFAASAYRVHFPLFKGVSILRETISVPLLEEYARVMMEACGYEGVCGFDFRYSVKDEKFYFLECNPRFSGGISSSIASGLDLPSLLLEAFGSPSTSVSGQSSSRQRPSAYGKSATLLRPSAYSKSASLLRPSASSASAPLLRPSAYGDSASLLRPSASSAPASLRSGVVTKSFSAARSWRRKFPSARIPSLKVDRYDDLPLSDLPALFYTLFHK